jgi:hypothetical protein
MVTRSAAVTAPVDPSPSTGTRATGDQAPLIAMIEPGMLSEIIQAGLQGPYSFAGMAMPLLYYADDSLVLRIARQ